MFKELGEFIDNVGRATGRMIGQMLSDKDDDDEQDGMMEDIVNLPDDIQGLPDLSEHHYDIKVKSNDE